MFCTNSIDIRIFIDDIENYENLMPCDLSYKFKSSLFLYCDFFKHMSNLTCLIYDFIGFSVRLKVTTDDS